nr:family 43 glycosylhydrolase [Hymenobacter sp. J193]
MNPAGVCAEPRQPGLRHRPQLFFQSKDGQEDWIIYHANSNPNEGCVEKRNPRMQKFTWNADGTPNFGVPVAINQPILKPSGE